MNSCVLLLVFLGCVTGFYVHPDVVFFSSEPEDSITCEGCSVELSCEVQLRESELPQPVIEWQVNGTAVSDVFTDVSFSYSSSDADDTGLYHCRSLLSIVSTQLEHGGVYRCVARDGENEDLCDVHPCVPTITVSGEAMLYVLGNYSGPHRMVTVPSCSVTVLQCGSLPSKEAVELIYVWKRNGVELDQNDEDGGSSTSGSGGSLTLDTYVLPTGGLVLYSYGQGVSGQYECVATVKGNNTLTLDQYDVQQSTGSLPSSPAVTVFTTTSFRTTNSSQPQLVCVVDDFCPETMQWSRDGILTAGDAVVHYPSLPSEASVTSYCCEATAGNQTFTGCVEIQTFTEPAVSTATVLLDDPQDSNITLHCSTNDTVHWSHNGERLNNSSTGVLVVSRFNTTAELYGVYQCFVSNPAGSSVAVVRVLPRGIPNPPRNIHIMEIPWPHPDKRPAIRIDWSPPLYRAGLDRLQYQVEHVIGYLNTSRKITNETFIDVFAAGYGYTTPEVMIIDPDSQETVIVSEISDKRYRLSEGLCVDEVLFPPVLHVSCVGPDGTIQWDNDQHNNEMTYPGWSTPQYYIIRGICTLPGTTPLVYNETFTESGHDSVQDLPIGTLCTFQGAATPEPTPDFYEPCYNTSLLVWSTGGCTVTATVGFEHQEYAVHENNGTVEVCVEAVGFGFSVSIATNNSGTAQVGEDYSIGPLDNLDFPSNVSTRRCIFIYIVDDMVVEDAVEQFTVTLTPTNDTLVEITSNATIYIIDTSTAIFSFTQPSYAVSEDDGFVIICVSEDAELRRDILMTLATLDVTAFVGLDYLPFEVTFTYDANTNTHCGNITILDDNYVEGGEEFLIQLQSDDPAVELPTDSAVVEVVDDDGAVFGIESPRYVIDEDVGSVVVCVALESGNLRRDVLVTLATLNDTAIAGEDYKQVETEFTFNNFENKHCIHIHILNTTSVEGTKTFTVYLRINDPQVIVGFSTASAVIEITESTDVIETSSSTLLSLGALGVLLFVVIGVVALLSVFLLYRWNKRSALKKNFFPIFPGTIEKNDIVDPEKWDDTTSILTELDPLQQEPDIPVQNTITIQQDQVPIQLHLGTTAEACRKISDNSGCTDSTSPYIYPPSIIDSGIDSGQSGVLPPRRFFSSDLHESSSPLEVLPTLSDKDERGLAATGIPEFRDDDSAISLDSEEHCYLETQV